MATLDPLGLPLRSFEAAEVMATLATELRLQQLEVRGRVSTEVVRRWLLSMMFFFLLLLLLADSHWYC